MVVNVLDSVVFASAYRFSVLFSYSANDPTYTLAPTVGWTAIEMSAGIVSACLPILRPVIQAAARGLGIKRGVFGRDHGTSVAFTQDGVSHGVSRVMRSTSEGTDAELVNSKNGTFYRLSDDNASGQMTTDSGLPVNAKLRPNYGYGYSVTSKPGKRAGEGDSLSGDEIPLHSIRVQTDFKHSTTRSEKV
jgi:hypothetical protein